MAIKKEGSRQLLPSIHPLITSRTGTIRKRAREKLLLAGDAEKTKNEAKGPVNGVKRVSRLIVPKP